MTTTILLRAIVKFLLGVVLVGILILLAAGTTAFFAGWLLMGILFVPMLLTRVVIMIKNPALLKARPDAKETQKEQSVVQNWTPALYC